MPVLRPNSHDNMIDITVNLSALASGSQSFGTILLLDKDESLNSNTVLTYTSVAQATADEAAGYISPWALAAITAAFAERGPQGQRISQIKVGLWDAAGGDTVSVALTEILAVDTDFYVVCISTRTDADILELNTAITAQESAGTKLIGFVQSADSDWLTTGGIPAALSAIDNQERIVVLYHDTASAPMEVRWAANRLAFDPDEQSVPFNTGLVGGTALATALTAAQKGFALTNNANTALLTGTTGRYFVRAGVNMNGRPVSEVLTADWMETRMRERLADLMVLASARGEKIAVNADGANLVAAEVSVQLQAATAADHIEDGQYVVTAEAITSADLSARRIRLTAEATVEVPLDQVSLTVNLSTEAVVADALS